MIMLASYCRVSTDKDDQANSFESQRRYFREYSEVTFTETQDEVEEAIRKLEGKKREVLDAFFSKVISKDDVRFMNAAYDEQIKALKEKLEALRNLNSLEYDIRDLADDIEAHLQMIAKANPDDELFCRNLLDKMVVHPNRRVEIKLNLLPPSWAYVLARLEELRRLKAAENEGCHNNSSVSPLSDPFPIIFQPKNRCGATTFRVGAIMTPQYRCRSAGP